MTFLQSTLTGLLLTALASCVAQEPNDKIRHDETYSTHNYKHVNKAAQARRWEQSPTVSVRPDTTRNVIVSSYKQSRSGTGRSGGLTISHTPSATMADRHYKTKNWLKTQAKPEVAKKPGSVLDYPNTGN